MTLSPGCSYTDDLNALQAQFLARQATAQPLRRCQQQLVTMITQELSTLTPEEMPHQRSLLELEGVGAEIWAGIDAQKYVNKLRKEWDHR